MTKGKSKAASHITKGKVKSSQLYNEWKSKVASHITKGKVKSSRSYNEGEEALSLLPKSTPSRNQGNIYSLLPGRYLQYCAWNYTRYINTLVAVINKSHIDMDCLLRGRLWRKQC